jgi:NitT/TauT family transport system substrate-binding protein
MMTRRRFVSGLAAGVVSSLDVGSIGAEPSPETTRIRLLQSPSICWAPQYLAEELLRTEGFTEVQYTKSRGGKEAETLLAAGGGSTTPKTRSASTPSASRKPG